MTAEKITVRTKALFIRQKLDEIEADLNDARLKIEAVNEALDDLDAIGRGPALSDEQECQ